MDGNVERVLQRLEGRVLTSRQSWQKAQELLAPSRPSDFNQAAMELGATVCLPREPRCPICPIRNWCAAQGEVRRPNSPARQKKKEIWCALDRRDGHVRLVRRPQTAALMAGMWELPQWKEFPHASACDAHWRTFRHSITVTDYTIHFLRNWAQKSRAPRPRGNWIAVAEIPALPITGLTRKILKADGII